MSLLSNLFHNKKLIKSLVRRDIVAAYFGSIFGNTWVVVDPLINILITLIFFQFAIKSSNPENVPYAAWVLPAIIFWSFISLAINSTINSIKEYSFLLRHKSIDMRLIVVIKILAAAIVHLILLLILLALLWILYGIKFNYYTFLLIYYLLAMSFLIFGMGLLISSLGAFLKDTRNFVAIFIQLEFWTSPIFWEPDRFPKAVALIMKLNPFYYPIHGYRQAVLASPFGSDFALQTTYFWIVVIAIYFFGNWVFTKLSPAFGDVT